MRTKARSQHQVAEMVTGACTVLGVDKIIAQVRLSDFDYDDSCTYTRTRAFSAQIVYETLAY
jgi:hypothetical protein